MQVPSIQSIPTTPRHPNTLLQRLQANACIIVQPLVDWRVKAFWVQGAA